MLLLGPVPSDFAGSEIVSGWSPIQRKIEAAGLAFQEKFIRVAQEKVRPEEEDWKPSTEEQERLRHRGGFHSHKKAASLQDIDVLLSGFSMQFLLIGLLS
jgi:hypothetical protein